jgi:hypothetical protein
MAASVIQIGRSGRKLDIPIVLYTVALSGILYIAPSERIAAQESESQHDKKNMAHWRILPRLRIIIASFYDGAVNCFTIGAVVCAVIRGLATTASASTYGFETSCSRDRLTAVRKTQPAARARTVSRGCHCRLPDR